MRVFIFILLFSFTTQAGIVNSDDRHEISDSPIEIQDISKSIAALIPKSRVQKLEDGRFKLSGLSYIDDLNFCKDENFVSTQRLIANCSASLVGRNKIATAAHCIDDEQGYSINDYYIVFDYTYNGEAMDELILERNSVYEIKSLLQHTFDFPGDKDVALLELKENVKGRTPLKVAKNRIKEGSEIFMLGFPLGLPMKYHDNGFVTSSTTNLKGQSSFTHNLDTFSVNSGSSIFSSSTNEIIGILVRGTGMNYEMNDKKKCNTWGRGDHHSGEANYIDILDI